MNSHTGNSKSSKAELEQSIEWFQQTVAQIKSLKVNPCPKSYAIWYEYYSGRNESLSKELDRHLRSENTFDERLTNEIYTRYFQENAQDKLAEIRCVIRALIDQLAKELNEFGVGMESYEQVLHDCVDQIADDMDVKALRLMVDFLLTETKNCRSANQQAIDSVSRASGEIDEMRKTLKLLSEEVLEDALTGVSNRRALDKALEELLTDRTEDQKDCLLMVDIDRFKQVNDRFGHVVGDRVLRFIAEMLKRSVKGQDFVARFGGEEFAIILPNTDYRGGISIAKSILKAVSGSRLTINKDGHSLGRVTLSAGLSVVKVDDTPESLVMRADDLLYKAKESGRNTVVGERE